MSCSSASDSSHSSAGRRVACQLVFVQALTLVRTRLTGKWGERGEGGEARRTLLCTLVPGADDDLALLWVVGIEGDDLVAVDVLVEEVERAVEEDVGVLVAALAACRVLWCHVEEFLLCCTGRSGGLSESRGVGGSRRRRRDEARLAFAVSSSLHRSSLRSTARSDYENPHKLSHRLASRPCAELTSSASPSPRSPRLLIFLDDHSTGKLKRCIGPSRRSQIDPYALRNSCSTPPASSSSSSSSSPSSLPLLVRSARQHAQRQVVQLDARQLWAARRRQLLPYGARVLCVPPLVPSRPAELTLSTCSADRNPHYLGLRRVLTTFMDQYVAQEKPKRIRVLDLAAGSGEATEVRALSLLGAVERAQADAVSARRSCSNGRTLDGPRQRPPRRLLRQATPSQLPPPHPLLRQPPPQLLHPRLARLSSLRPASSLNEPSLDLLVPLHSRPCPHPSSRSSRPTRSRRPHTARAPASPAPSCRSPTSQQGCSRRRLRRARARASRPVPPRATTRRSSRTTSSSSRSRCTSSSRRPSCGRSSTS